MLQQFVNDFSKLYGKECISQNVHNLLHICRDVKKYGVLDNFSAFRFENYMSTIKGMIRKGDKPLEQIARRYAEMEAAEEDLCFVPELSLQQPHNDGPLTEKCINVKQQYKFCKSKSYTIDCNNSKDCCVLLEEGTFAKISNILQYENNKIGVIEKKMLHKESLCDEPDSRLINIHIVVPSNALQFSRSIDEIQRKVWKIPC